MMNFNKKRPADNSEPTPARGNKRRAATTAPAVTRVTRSAYKKLNEKHEGTEKLNPGLPMDTRRRRKRPMPGPSTPPDGVITTTSVLAVAKDCRQVCTPRGQPPTVAQCGDSVEGRPSETALVSYALGVGADGRRVCIPLTPDDPSAEDQWRPAPSSIVVDSACATSVLTGAANPSGPAPVAYMGGGLDDDTTMLPGDWKLICATYGPRASVSDGHGSPRQVRASCSDACSSGETTSGSGPPVHHKSDAPKRVRILSNALPRWSIVSPLSGAPVANCPPRHPSAIPCTLLDAELDSEVPADITRPWGDLFDPSWCFPAKNEDLRVSVGEEEPVSAVVRASYSLSQQDAIELLVNERILQEHRNRTESLVVEIACSPVSKFSRVNWTAKAGTMIDTDSTVAENHAVEQGTTEESMLETTFMLPGAGPLEWIEITLDENEASAQSEDEPLTCMIDSTTKPLGNEMTDSNVEANESPAASISLDQNGLPECLRPKPAIEVSEEQEQTSAEQSTGSTLPVISQGNPAFSPPWPYSTQMSDLPTDGDDQYSVETYDEDSVIY